MTFIRKKIVENDLDTAEVSDIVDAGIEAMATKTEDSNKLIYEPLSNKQLQYILDNDIQCTFWNEGEEQYAIVSTLDTVWDREVHSAPYQSKDGFLFNFIKPIEELPSMDESTIVEDGKRFYNWLDIIDILSEYVDSESIEEIKNDWQVTYADKPMSQEDIDDILKDLVEIYGEAEAEKIKQRFNSTSDPVSSKEDFIQSDLNTLNDVLDKLFSIEVKEKLINLIDELKN